MGSSTCVVREDMAAGVWRREYGDASFLALKCCGCDACNQKIALIAPHNDIAAFRLRIMK